MIEVSGIALSLDALLPGAYDVQKREVAHALGVKPSLLQSCTLTRRSVDARKKNQVHFTTTFACTLGPEQEQRLLAKAPKGLHVKQAKPYEPLEYPDCSHTSAKVVVVGAGPAGLFAALYLARCGVPVVLVERGFDVDTRAGVVTHFEKTGNLNPQCNIQFGEGGAGTFSDGKLTTNIKSPNAPHVLHWFVQAGAPEAILVESRPHLGSDKLPGLVRAMREEIRSRGGEVRFSTQLVDWEFDQGHVSAAVIEDVNTHKRETLPASHIIVACGHSARDVFELCKHSGLAMEQKPFSVGVRIEHPQELINKAQWGKAAKHPALGAAEYKLAVHLPSGRSVYTFCMCPGGEVVAAASEEGGVVTNGMSKYARAGKNANSAVLVNVDPSDFGSSDVLAGVYLQRKIEQAAFQCGIRHKALPYQAPAQTVGAFLKEHQEHHPSSVPSSTLLHHDQASDMSLDQASGTSSDQTSTSPQDQASFKPLVHPTYGRGVFQASLSECLPAFVTDALAQALPLMGRKLAHFDDPGAVMTAPETRSSSPVRICRSKTYQAYWAADHKGCLAANDHTKDAKVYQNACSKAATAENDGTGIFPCGEGPGYAGGIMSAACDGLRVAQYIASQLAG